MPYTSEEARQMAKDADLTAAETAKFVAAATGSASVSTTSPAADSTPPHAAARTGRTLLISRPLAPSRSSERTSLNTNKDAAWEELNHASRVPPLSPMEKALATQQHGPKPQLELTLSNTNEDAAWEELNQASRVPNPSSAVSTRPSGTLTATGPIKQAFSGLSDEGLNARQYLNALGYSDDELAQRYLAPGGSGENIMIVAAEKMRRSRTPGK